MTNAEKWGMSLSLTLIIFMLAGVIILTVKFYWAVIIAAILTIINRVFIVNDND